MLIWTNRQYSVSTYHWTKMLYFVGIFYAVCYAAQFSWIRTMKGNLYYLLKWLLDSLKFLYSELKIIDCGSAGNPSTDANIIKNLKEDTSLGTVAIRVLLSPEFVNQITNYHRIMIPIDLRHDITHSVLLLDTLGKKTKYRHLSFDVNSSTYTNHRHVIWFCHAMFSSCTHELIRSDSDIADRNICPNWNQ